MPRSRPPVVLRCEPVLGTLLEVQVTPSIRRLRTIVGSHRRAQEVGEEVGEELVAELRRLEAVFSIHGPSSELARWRAGPVGAAPERLSPELTALLADSLRWQEASRGAYNPAVGEAARRWQWAGQEGIAPGDDELAAIAHAIRRPRYRVLDDGTVQRTGDCSALTFDAFAKGRCIDLAVTAVSARHPLRRLVVNLGGDLVHRGDGSLIVGIENPARPYDNEPPVATVEVRRQGLATSGAARRGVEVGGRWYSHVIDPRSARPVDALPSATTVARDAATADVLATLLAVLPPDESLPMIRRLALDPSLVGDGDVACCVVLPDGRIVTDATGEAPTPQRVVR